MHQVPKHLPEPNNVAARGRSSVRKPYGFTLIEVMIVVGIVAILGGIALPAYNNYIRRGQLVEALALLGDYRIKMEQYYQDNRGYGPDGGDCANGNLGPSWATFTTHTSENFTFSCQLTGGSNQAFLVTATGSSGLASGTTYTINESNQRTTTSYKGTAVSKNCWLVKGDEC